MKRVKILGYWYEINEELASDIIEAEGKVDTHAHVIYLAKDLCNEERMSALFHEILEVVNKSYELELQHNKITTLETALYQIFLDNDFITSRDGIEIRQERKR